jgi:RimJ/RimL family protein N-acetyltransferase
MPDLFPKSMLLPSQETLLLREAEAEDAAALITYFNEVAGETDFLSFGQGEFRKTIPEEAAILRSFQGSANEIYFLGIIAGEIAGSVSVHASPKVRMRHVGEFGICVRQAHWGKGIGAILMQQMIDWATQNPVIRKLTLRTSALNPAAIRLYERFGFQYEGRLVEDFFIRDTYSDTILMGLILPKDQASQPKN